LNGAPVEIEGEEVRVEDPVSPGSLRDVIAGAANVAPDSIEERESSDGVGRDFPPPKALGEGWVGGVWYLRASKNWKSSLVIGSRWGELPSYRVMTKSEST
jgi:hypothetical protein